MMILNISSSIERSNYKNLFVAWGLQHLYISSTKMFYFISIWMLSNVKPVYFYTAKATLWHNWKDHCWPPLQETSLMNPTNVKEELLIWIYLIKETWLMTRQNWKWNQWLELLIFTHDFFNQSGHAPPE